MDDSAVMTEPAARPKQRHSIGALKTITSAKKPRAGPWRYDRVSDLGQRRWRAQCTPEVGLLLPGLAAGLLVGFCEELGWTGFAIPRLRLRYGVLATGLLVGVLWGLWHFPLFWQSGSFSGVLLLALLLAQLFSWLPAYRVLMVWVYDRTGSLLVAMLMHASQTATSMVLVQADITDARSLTSILVSAAAWWLLVAAVAVANRGQLARRPLPMRAA